MAISDELRKLVDPNNECCCEHCLGNKCKEWAWLKEYRLISGKFDDNSFYCDIETSEYDEHKVCIAADTEPEAIFKACNYILENLNIRE